MGTTDTAPAPTTSPPDPGTDFLGWLEFKRDETGLPWAEVSRRSGISENGLRKIRQGDTTPRPATREALASAFRIDWEGVDDLTAQLAQHYAPGAVSADVGAMPPIPARRGDGGATTFLTIGVASPRATRLDPATAGRLIAFLETTARAWLATAECTDD